MKRLACFLLFMLLPLTALADVPFMTEEEAVALAREEILSRCLSDDSSLPYTLGDFERCVCVTAFYRENYDDGHDRWFVDFSIPTADVARWPDRRAYPEWTQVFDVIIPDDPALTIVRYDDPDSMTAICFDAKFAHVGQPLRFWSLEDKQVLCEQLLAAYEREMTRYGALPPLGYVRLLEHVQSVPREGELTEEEAVELARVRLSLTEGQPAVYLWRDEGQPARYHIEFYTGDGDLLGETDFSAEPVKF